MEIDVDLEAEECLLLDVIADKFQQDSWRRHVLWIDMSPCHFDLYLLVEEKLLNHSIVHFVSVRSHEIPRFDSIHNTAVAYTQTK
jgi:hypothetical protein